MNRNSTMEDDEGFQDRSVFERHLQTRVRDSTETRKCYTRANAIECYKCLKLLADPQQRAQYSTQYSKSESALADLTGETMMASKKNLKRHRNERPDYSFVERTVGSVTQLDYLTKYGKPVLVIEEYYDAASEAYKELLTSPSREGVMFRKATTTARKIQWIQQHLLKRYELCAILLDRLNKKTSQPDEASTDVANAEVARSIPSDNASDNDMPRPAVVNITGWDVQPFSPQDGAATRNTAESVQPPEAALSLLSTVKQASMPTDEEDSMAEDSDSFDPGAGEDGEFDPAEPLGYDAPDQMTLPTKIDDDPVGMHALSSMRISAGSAAPGPVANGQASAHDIEAAASDPNEASTDDAVPRPAVVSFNDIPFLPSEGRAATHNSVESLSDSSEASYATAAKSLQTLESGELSFFDAEQASLSTDQEDSNIEENRICPDADVWPWDYEDTRQMVLPGFLRKNDNPLDITAQTQLLDDFADTAPVANGRASAHDSEASASIPDEASTDGAVPRSMGRTFNPLRLELELQLTKSVESLSKSSEAFHLTSVSSVQSAEAARSVLFDTELAKMRTHQEDSKDDALRQVA